MLNFNIIHFSVFGFKKLKFFDDHVARCMQGIDAVDSKDLSQKCEFFTKLAHTIPAIPRVSNAPSFSET